MFVPIHHERFLPLLDWDDGFQFAESHRLDGVQGFASLINDFLIKFVLLHLCDSKEKSRTSKLLVRARVSKIDGSPIEPKGYGD